MSVGTFLRLVITHPEQISFIKDLFRIDRSRWFKKNAANLVTFTRLICVSILFYQFWIFVPITKVYYSSFYLTIYCWISDWFDGIYAKVNNATTQFGAWFDRITDKFFDLAMFKMVYLFSPELAWIVIISESILFIFSILEVIINISAKSGFWGKMKFAVRAGACWVFFIPILVSQGGIEGHKIARIIGMIFYSSSLFLGGMSIAFHGLKTWEKVKVKEKLF